MPITSVLVNDSFRTEYRDPMESALSGYRARVSATRTRAAPAPPPAPVDAADLIGIGETLMAGQYEDDQGKVRSIFEKGVPAGQQFFGTRTAKGSCSENPLTSTFCLGEWPAGMPLERLECGAFATVMNRELPPLAEPGEKPRRDGKVKLTEPAGIAARLATEISFMADDDWQGHDSARELFCRMAMARMKDKKLGLGPAALGDQALLLERGLIDEDGQILSEPPSKRKTQYPGWDPLRDRPTAGINLRLRKTKTRPGCDMAVPLVVSALDRLVKGTAEVLLHLPDSLHKRWNDRAPGELPVPVWVIAWEAIRVQCADRSYDIFRLITTSKVGEVLDMLLDAALLHVRKLSSMRREGHRWRCESRVLAMGPADELTAKRVARQLEKRAEMSRLRREKIAQLLSDAEVAA